MEEYNDQSDVNKQETDRNLIENVDALGGIHREKEKGNSQFTQKSLNVVNEHTELLSTALASWFDLY